MPKIEKKINEIELGRLRQIYLKAETDIVNEIGRLRALGNIDYHAVAALERIQRILRKMEDDAWEYIPIAIELQFYANHPEKSKRLESTSKHLQGYLNAESLTSEQMDVVFILANNLRDEIHNASERTETILRNTLTGKKDPVLKSLEVLPEREPPSIPVSALSNHLQYVPIGRREQDIYREISLENVTLSAATGAGNRKTANEIYKELAQQGVTAFVDKSGRKWSLHSYCEMVTRTTDRQANVLAVLTAHTEHDLYIVSRSGSACPVCAPIEGRVFSKSGTSPYYPPLASIFGLVDPEGPADLTNTWLNIHPNCVHSISEWDETGKSEKEIEKIRNFSSYETNPRTNDPRTQKQIEAYRRNQAARAKELRDYKQWEKYRMELGDDVPKTFQTFQKHKRAGDEKYKLWKLDYDRRMDLAKHPEKALPNADMAVAAEEKFTKYFFNPENIDGYSKGRSFNSHLWYNINNWEEMRDEILNVAKKYPARYRNSDQYGDRYSQLVILQGKKGTPANVLLAWNVTQEGETRLTTAHMEEI